jgi:hypothetical protein
MTYSERLFAALVIRYAARMRRTILSYFSTLSHKRNDFSGEKKFTEHKMCVLIFSKLSASNISHSNNNSASYD